MTEETTTAIPRLARSRRTTSKPTQGHAHAEGDLELLAAVRSYLASRVAAAGSAPTESAAPEPQRRG